MKNAVTRRLRSAAVCLISCAAMVAEAGVRFDFVAEATGYTYSGKMSLDGTKMRVDIASGAHPMFRKDVSLISRNAATEILLLDHARRTYFQRQVGHIGGPVSTARGLGNTRVTKQRLTSSKEKLTGAGRATERHKLSAEYSLEMEIVGEKMGGLVRMEAEFDIDPDIPQRAHPWGLQHAAKTGFDKLDKAIAARIPDRLPIRQFVSFARQIAGGPLITETLTLVLSNVIEEEIDGMEFYPPSAYPYEEPVFSFGP